jgi:hypothetical protein
VYLDQISQSSSRLVSINNTGPSLDVSTLSVSPRVDLSDESSMSEEGASIGESDNSSSAYACKSNCEEKVDFKTDLKCWAVTHNITGLGVNDLLKLLRKHDVCPTLPLHHRTLFEKKSLPPIKQVGDGSYCHIGIQCNIIRHLIEDCITVPLTDHFRLKLALSFDGFFGGRLI